MKPTNILVTAIITALILAGLAAPAAAFSGAGSGTESDPYIINTPAQLQEIKNDLDAYYQLGNDIDISSFTSGFIISSDLSAPFSGTLDGNYHKLYGLSTSISNTWSLFGYGDVSATAKNIWFDDINIISSTSTSTLAEISLFSNFGTIYNIRISDISLSGNSPGTWPNSYGSMFYVFKDVYNIHDIEFYTNQIISGRNYCLFSLIENGEANNIYAYGAGDIISKYPGTAGGTSGYISYIDSIFVNFKSVSGQLNAKYPGRITLPAEYEDCIVSNCFAADRMVVSTTSGFTSNGYNGESIAAGTYQTEIFFKNTLGWNFMNVWEWDGENLKPKLQGFDSVPPTIFSISVTPATGGQLTEYTLSISATTEAAGGITGYQWAYSTDSGNTWQAISGATTATYVWQPGIAFSGDIQLKCTVTGADGGTVDSYEAGYANIKITIVPPPEIDSVSVSRPLQKVNTPTILTATLTESEPATYQWYYSTNGGTTWQPISGATALTAEYTPATTGTHSVKIVVTTQYGDTTETTTNFNVLPTYTPTAITNTSVDISIDSAAKYQGMQQLTLSAELKALNYYTPTIAHLAHDNALYYLDSAKREVTPVSTTTGGTISAAYLGQYTGVITDTAGNTAFYSYQTNDWQYIEQINAQIIASTASYAATVSGGTINIYNLNGNLVASTATTAANLAGNDQTNVFVSYSGATITYYWYQNNEIKTASQTLPHTITELHQISTTSNWLISTTANTYTVRISDTGSYELLSTTDTDTPLIHTQATNIGVLIGVAEPNEIFIVGADGETDGTYATGSTLNDASIAKATGLFAITGGEDRQVYILAKSTSSTWQLLQTISFGAAIDHSQISTTGTYAAVSTGLKLYLLEAVDISANTYLLQGVIIGSSGSVWANKPFTINGDNLRTDANGRFIYSVQPATLYTIVTDTTTTEYTATNAALQQIAIKLRPNPFAQSVSYSTDYNADTRNFEMIYTDTRDLTSSVTWVIRETGNQTIVSTQTVQAGQTAYWEVPLDKSFTSYQISMIADRQGTNVENVWIITPEGNPINIPGLDETGRTIIFGAVLMIFGALFGVMHSTKGALLTVALAGVMTYLGLLNIPWVIIMVAGTIAVAAILGKGSGGS